MYRGLLLLLALVALAAVAYAPLAHAGWIWDDDSYVTQNPALTAPDGLRQIWWPGGTPQFYPLVFTTFLLETKVYGPGFAESPLGFHVVNWSLHVSSAVLVWRILARLCIPGAWLAAALFCLHPMQVESVAWVTERKNVLSMLLALASFRAWLACDASTGRGGWYALSLGLFVMAMLAKTTVAALAPALVLYHLWRGDRWTARCVGAIVPFFVMGIPLGLLTAWLERHHVRATGADFALGTMDRVVLAPRAAWFYVWTWVWPANLAFIYPRWIVDARVPLQWLPLAAAFACIVGAAWAWSRAWRAPLILIALFGAAIFPALGFIDVYPFRYSYVADHFAYIASIPLAIATAWLAASLAPRWVCSMRARAAATAAVLLGLAGMTYAQTGAYHDEETLWRRTLATNPGAWMPASNLAAILVKRAGDVHIAGDAEHAVIIAAEAEGFARLAIQSNDRQFTTWSNLSEALRVQGKSEEALAAALAAQDLAPNISHVHWAVGRLLELTNDGAGALAAYQRGAALPDAGRAEAIDSASRAARLGDYARLLALMGRDREATQQWELLLTLAPENALIAANLGSAYARLQQWDDARDALAHAITHAPDDGFIEALMPRFVEALLVPPIDATRAAELRHTTTWLLQRTGRGDPMALVLAARAAGAAGVSSEAKALLDEARTLAAQITDPIGEQVREEIERRTLELPTIAPKPATIVGDVRTLTAVKGDPSLALAPRDLLVWLPPGYGDEANRERRYPVVYLMDGQNAFDAVTSFAGEWKADETAARLISERRIEPLILVAVPNSAQRMDEYTVDADSKHGGGGGAAFLAYLRDAVKASVDGTFRTKPERESTAIVGSSLGGLIALAAIERESATFGRVAAMSPSLWWGDEALLKRWSDAAKRPDPVRLWIDMGTREGGANAAAHVARARRLGAMFTETEGGAAAPTRTVHLSIVEGAEHNEAAWSARFGDALQFLFPPDAK